MDSTALSNVTNKGVHMEIDNSPLLRRYRDSTREGRSEPLKQVDRVH